jgi:hypothetical protein
LIKKATTYDDIHDQVKETLKINEKLAHDIVAHGLKYYNLPQEELTQFIAWQDHNQTPDNQERVHEVLQHVWRDWADEGLHERAAPIEFLTKHLLQLFPEEERENRKEGPVKILFPGSGLGRLPHDVAKAMPDAEITANELSCFMRLAYRYVESLTSPDMAKYYPFSDWWAYQKDRASLLHKVSFPDEIVNSTGALLVEGNFNKVFTEQESHFDAVVTFFFIDTAENVLEYYDTIAHVLKPGGYWLNIGPLLWHNCNTEFSLEDLLNMAEKGYGFEMLDLDEEWGPVTIEGKKARGRNLSYQCHAGALRLHEYPVQYFAGRLKEKKQPSDQGKDEL